MPIDTLVQEVKEMPEELILETLRYVRYLKLEIRGESRDKELSGAQKKIYRKAGRYKGQIWMSDDFDAPLEDFREYME